MSDDKRPHIERLTELLDDMGIVWTKDEPEAEDPPGTAAIRVYQGDGPKNQGYPYFFTVYVFAPDGSLLYQWIGE